MLILTLTLLACAPEMSGPQWSDEGGYALYDDGDTYIAVATRAHPNREERAQVGDHADRVEAALNEAEGLIYYSLSGSILKGEAQTVSVWRTQEEMWAFVTTGAHQDAKDDIEFEFEHAIWEVDGAELPLDFRDAQAMMDG